MNQKPLIQIRNIVVFANEILGLPLHDGQIEWLKKSNRLINILKPSNQWGKFSPTVTPILTPYGWKQMGEIKTGDTVFSKDGSQTKVVGVYPQGKQDIVKFIFDDGVSLDVGIEHLWYCQTPSNRFSKNFDEKGRNYKNKNYQKWEVLSTREIIDKWGKEPKSRNRVSIPVVEPIQFDVKKVPIAPYLLGVLLGDGSFCGQTRLTSADKEIVDCFNVRYLGRYSYRVIGLDKEIIDLGLKKHRAWEKFVPYCYLFNSVENRLAILQGLMDTDGNIETNGKIEYCTTSKQLKDDITFLVQSFGGKVKTTERFTQYPYKGEKKTGRLSYRLRIKISVNPFRLKKKANRFHTTERTYNRILHKIIPQEKQEAVCIKVEHSSGLYVAKDFIVTHNTTIEAVVHIYQAVCKPQLDRFNMDFATWLKTRYETLNFGKTYEVAKGVMEHVIDITEGEYLLPDGHFNHSLLKGWGIKKIDEPPRLPRIIWYNNSVTLIRSYDGLGESFKRKKLAFVGGDECGDIPELNLFLNGTLIPRVAFFKGSIHLVGTSQPKGLEYEEISENAEKVFMNDPDNGEYFVISANTNPEMAQIYQNKFMPIEHIKRVEAIADPQLRRQIIYGIYVDWTKHIYSWEEVTQMFSENIPYDKETGFSELPIKDAFYVWAVDMAAASDETSSTCVRYNIKKLLPNGDEFYFPHKVVYHKAWKGNSFPLSLQYEMIKQDFLKFKDISPMRTKFVYDAGSLGGKNTGQAFKELNGYPFPPKGRGYADVKAEGFGKIKELVGKNRKFSFNEKGLKVEENLNWGGLRISPALKELRRQIEVASMDDVALKNDQFSSLMMACHFIEARAPKGTHSRAVDFNFSRTLNFVGA